MKLRSAEWFEGEGLRAFSHNARMRQLGMNPAEHLGKPVHSAEIPLDGTDRAARLIAGLL